MKVAVKFELLELFLRDHVEPFSRYTAIIEALFALELNIEPPTQVMWPDAHNFGETFLKHIISRNVDLHVLGHGVRLTQVAKLAILPAKRALPATLAIVLLALPRILERRHLVLVVDEVANALLGRIHVPILGQRRLSLLTLNNKV